MSYHVKELYKVWFDDDGHDHLIRVADHRKFIECLIRLLSNEIEGSDSYYEELDLLLDRFSTTVLEGQETYVVLEGDLIG